MGIGLIGANIDKRYAWNQWSPYIYMVCFWCWTDLNKMFNSLRPRQNGRLFADDTFKRIFLNENIRIPTKNSLKFVPKGLINIIPALVLIMDWSRPGYKPLSESMLVRSLTHICVIRPQWVNDMFITLSREQWFSGRHQLDMDPTAKVSDRCLMDVNPRVYASWVSKITISLN